ncbi:MAG: hypothetical protein ACI8W3_001462 [Myxococcota bacterium]|jgi:hypothetical protein
MLAEPSDPSSNRYVVVLESPKGLETMDLSRRLRELDQPMIIATSLDEVEHLVGAQDPLIGALFIPSTFKASDLEATLKRIRSTAPAPGVGFVSVGDALDKPERKKLRKVGVKLALWNPMSEPTLRFQLNRALHADRNTFGERDHARVPTQFGCDVTLGGRTKEAEIYSLATNGAFLSTKRALMNGAHVELEMRLPERHIRAFAEVMYANVPGNLQRPGLPLGMAVRFDNLTADDHAWLKSFVASRVEKMEV